MATHPMVGEDANAMPLALPEKVLELDLSGEAIASMSISAMQ
jgi:hypothetical protein